MGLEPLKDSLLLVVNNSKLGPKMQNSSHHEGIHWALDMVRGGWLADVGDPAHWRRLPQNLTISSHS